ncbi:hypothetical protein [Silicimonas sp. MF1-12-2]|uniref:hypothetical protein n=1 Tax=Silicimonas sp. MF1-12-2 TaxID=3384793 RepID=UPI0039B5EC84
MANEFAMAGYDVTPVADIPAPTVPPATYDGYIVMDVGFDVYRESYAGAAQMTADFASNTVGGTASALYDTAGRPVAGVLTMNGGTIDRFADPVTEWQINSGLSGTLTDADGVDLNVSSTMDGDFLGPNAEGYYTIIDGSMTSIEYGFEFLLGTTIGQR